MLLYPWAVDPSGQATRELEQVITPRERFTDAKESATERIAGARENASGKMAEAREATAQKVSDARDATAQGLSGAREATAQGFSDAKAAAAEQIAKVKPRLRGISHEYAFFVSLVLGAALIIAADGFKATLAVAIYSVSLSALFGVSALYHVHNWERTSDPCRLR